MKGFPSREESPLV